MTTKIKKFSKRLITGAIGIKALIPPNIINISKTSTAKLITVIASCPYAFGEHEKGLFSSRVGSLGFANSIDVFASFRKSCVGWVEE